MQCCYKTKFLILLFQVIVFPSGQAHPVTIDAHTISMLKFEFKFRVDNTANKSCEIG